MIGLGRLLAVDHCRVSVSITSTVSSVVYFFSFPFLCLVFPSPSPSSCHHQDFFFTDNSGKFTFGWHGWEVFHLLLPPTSLLTAEECVGVVIILHSTNSSYEVIDNCKTEMDCWAFWEAIKPLLCAWVVWHYLSCKCSSEVCHVTTHCGWASDHCAWCWLTQFPPLREHWFWLVIKVLL